MQWKVLRVSFVLPNSSVYHDRLYVIKWVVKVVHGTNPGPKLFLTAVEGKKLSMFLADVAKAGLAMGRLGLGLDNLRHLDFAKENQVSTNEDLGIGTETWSHTWYSIFEAVRGFYISSTNSTSFHLETHCWACSSLRTSHCSLSARSLI